MGDSTIQLTVSFGDRVAAISCSGLAVADRIGAESAGTVLGSASMEDASVVDSLF